MNRKNRDFQPHKQKKLPAEIQFEPFEVTLEQCGGDFNKLVKRFIKKVKRSEILKPYYEKMYFKSKSQKKREKRFKAIYEQKKQQKKLYESKESKKNLDFDSLNYNYK